MNLTLKIVFIILLPLWVLSISCSKENSSEKVIKFWAMGAEAEYVTKLVPEFERLNPGIKVKVQQVPWTAAQEKLVTAFASDNTPDACQLGNTWVPQFAALDAIVPLNEYVKISDQINQEKYFPGIWETNVIDNQVFGIPWYIDTRVMFYRKDVFERAGYKNPPKNWVELLDLSQKIKAMHPREEKYAIYLPTNEWAPFVMFGMERGSSLLKNENTLGDFSSKEFKEAFKYSIEFHKQNLAPIGISQVTNVYQAFADEYFSIYISGPWNIPEFKKWMIGNLSDKWMTAPMPGYANDYPGVSLAGGSSLVIFKDSKYKKEVWKFFEYLSEKSTQIEFYKLLNNLPAIKEAWDDPIFKDDPYMQAFYLQFMNVRATPKIPEWEQIAFAKVQQYAELAARNVISVEEALRRLDKDVDRILEKRRWIVEEKKKNN
ncbi:MAG: sugar ABC transporter substrate-binding protein [Ignavibacteriales bacterium]|nr:sugar ABC transporter substrate-binding protein [Ignavibacteriales bacterium]